MSYETVDDKLFIELLAESLWGGSVLMGEIKVDDTKDKNNT